MNPTAEHWNEVYERKAPTALSWFQPAATLSIELIDDAAIPRGVAVIDVGAGASLLVDGLLARGYRDVTLLDVAASALAETRHRLGLEAQKSVQYLVADITSWAPQRKFGLWHDRAVFHFLTEASDRAAYREAMAAALEPGASVIIGTFALHGPERCSGLPVERYSATRLAEEFAGVLQPLYQRMEQHMTPNGATQSFQFVRFARI